MEELQKLLKDMQDRIDRLEKICADFESQKEVGGGNSENELEMEVSEILREIGVPAHIKGYGYLRQAIIMSVGNPDMINNITKLLYPDIARDNGDTPSRVERAMRHALEVSWRRGNVETIEKMFGYTVDSGKDKPTNSEFIAMIADRIRLERKAG